jgi:hypothetical protein
MTYIGKECRFYYNEKTDKIGAYTQCPTCGETDFPRGEWLAYQDFITTGFKSFAEAEAWQADFHNKTGIYEEKK